MRRLIFARLPDRFRDHHVALTAILPGQGTFLHSHDFPEFFLVTQGQGVHRWNGQCLPLSCGALVFVRAADRHSFEAGETGLRFVNLAVSPRWWRKFSRLFTPMFAPARATDGSKPAQVALSERSANRLEHEFGNLIERGARDPTSLPATMCLLAHEWLAPDRLERCVQPVPEWLERVVRAMDDPEMVSKPLAYWHAMSGRSPEHLARSCRRYYGRPLSALLSRARIEWVKGQLRRGDEKVAGLAMDAGFQNLGYFYRAFRQQEGCPPRAWFRRHASGATVPR